MPGSLASPLATAAATYARRGWPVLPLHSPTTSGCTCRNTTCESVGKHPRTRHGLRDATTDLDQITTWWRRWPHANIGIATGVASGLVVVDIDPSHGGERSVRTLSRSCMLPRTAQAGSGTGRHLYFATTEPVPSSVGGLGEGVDVRANGGYIVAPPSRHASGRLYRWITAAAVARLPAPLAVQMAASRRSAERARPVGDTDAYGRAVLEAEARTVALARPGRRNNTLNRAAFRLGQLAAAGTVTDSVVVDQLVAAAHECGLPDAEARRTISSGLAAGHRRPRPPTHLPPAIEL